MAFNTATASYAIETLLASTIPQQQYDLVLLDRGPIDAQCWFQVLATKQYLDPASMMTLRNFYTLPRWLHLIDSAVLLVCDPEVSEKRESTFRLAIGGNLATSPEFLNVLWAEYCSPKWIEATAIKPTSLIMADSSEQVADTLNLPYYVATRIAEVLEDSLNPRFLTVPRELIPFSGFHQADPDLLQKWESCYQLEAKGQAETDTKRKQIVVYAYIEQDGKLFRTRRTGPANRPELKNLLSIGVGGHVESGDLHNGDRLEDVLRGSMLRELKEELVFDAEPELELRGFINDESLNAGRYHVAVIYQAKARSGRIKVRAELSYGEFGPKSWALVPPEKVFEEASRFDPWSQLIIEHLLNGPPAQLNPQQLLEF